MSKSTHQTRVDSIIGSEYEYPPDGYYTIHNDWLCICSCGKQTLVKYDARKKHYVAVEKGWIFTPIGKVGWTCGEEGHVRGDNREIGEDAYEESYQPSMSLVRPAAAGELDVEDES